MSQSFSITLNFTQLFASMNLSVTQVTKLICMIAQDGFCLDDTHYPIFEASQIHSLKRCFLMTNLMEEQEKTECENAIIRILTDSWIHHRTFLSSKKQIEEEKEKDATDIASLSVSSSDLETRSPVVTNMTQPGFIATVRESESESESETEPKSATQSATQSASKSATQSASKSAIKTRSYLSPETETTSTPASAQIRTTPLKSIEKKRLFSRSSLSLTETNQQSKVICLGDDEEEEEEEEDSKMYPLLVEKDNQDAMSEDKLLEDSIPLTLTKEEKRTMKRINPSNLRSDRIEEVNTIFESFKKNEIKFFDIKSVFAKNFSVSMHLMNSFFKLMQLRENKSLNHNKILLGCELSDVIPKYSKILKNIRSVVYIPFVVRGIWCLCVINYQEHIMRIFNFVHHIRIDRGTDIYNEICKIIRLFDKGEKPDWKIVLQTRELCNHHDSGIAVCMLADFHINCATVQLIESNVVYYKNYILLSLSNDELSLFMNINNA